MLKAFLPPWLVAVLLIMSSTTVSLVESGLIPEGSQAYPILATISAVLTAFVGGRAAGVKKVERELINVDKLHLDHRAPGRDIRTKVPDILEGK